MISNKKITAIVPMRHNSERVPGKNYRLFNNKPLFYHITETLLNCKYVSDIIIDTDSDPIKDLISRDFPNIILLNRPSHLIDGDIPMNDVLMNIVNQYPSDFYLQTHSTNPLLSTKSIDTAISQFLNKFPIFDSLFSVTKKTERYWDILARPINHNQSILLRTQDLPPIFFENSCIYIFNKEILEKKYNRIGDRPYLFEIPEIESQDIDVELDFKIAELLHSQLYEKK